MADFKSGFWQYSANHQFFYGDAKKGGALAASATERAWGTQALEDWNREIKPEPDCRIFINGKSLYELRKGALFKDVAELKAFFAKEMFFQTNDADKEFLSSEAMVHFHQGGLPFASHHCLVMANMAKAPNIKLPQEEITVNFKSIKGGVSIIEDNVYPNLMVGNKKYRSSDYHAKTHSELSFTTKGVHIQNLTIDCPNGQAAKLLDRRTLMELLQHIIEKIEKLWQGTPAVDNNPKQQTELDVANLDEKAAVMTLKQTETEKAALGIQTELDVGNSSDEGVVTNSISFS